MEKLNDFTMSSPATVSLTRSLDQLTMRRSATTFTSALIVTCISLIYKLIS